MPGVRRFVERYGSEYGVALTLVVTKQDRFDGTVVTGLNRLLGTTVSKGELGVDNVDIDYNSNYIRQAMQQFAGFVPIANGWVNNWASY